MKSTSIQDSFQVCLPGRHLVGVVPENKGYRGFSEEEKMIVQCCTPFGLKSLGWVGYPGSDVIILWKSPIFVVVCCGGELFSFLSADDMKSGKVFRKTFDTGIYITDSSFIRVSLCTLQFLLGNTNSI